jgi:hypothetical protein
MKKMPCLFQRLFDKPHAATLLREVTPGCEWVLAGEGVASRKWDGTACMFRDGILYKRYDAKRGKTPPPGAIACCDPDPVTGHWPHWVVAGEGDKWHIAALRASGPLPDGTYELIGPHINGNPEGLDAETFRRHGDVLIDVERTFDGMREYLCNAAIEGIVFAHPDGRMCKIRRNDFGFVWGNKRGEAAQ